MEFYLDADNDLFTNIQVISLSDDVNLGYVHSNVEHRSFRSLSNGILFLLITMRNLVRFMT